mmetsp:Transcript_7431/g.14925  ORF Transcript_7431/g.14925 Transcript_7431/m.14925 type:complete len:143 (-) Transcript_7431:93-521(-)
MGKSVGFRFAGKGPGLQKTSKLSKKYLSKTTKKGKLSDLDFDVEQAPKLSKEEASTGLGAVRAPEAAIETSTKAKAKANEIRGSTSALGAPVVGQKRELTVAEKVGHVEWKRRVGNEDQDKAAREEMAAKQAIKKKKKCEPV